MRSDEEMNEEATGCQFCLSGAHSRKYRGNMEKMEERMKERKNEQSEDEMLKILISLGEMHFMCG